MNVFFSSSIIIASILIGLLLFALFALRRTRKQKAQRMLISENYITGAGGATTWDTTSGPLTSSELNTFTPPEPKEPRK